ncbi:hypothetical protein ACIO3O_19670 [Streptomyces sp. NPDC087440]|uniref:hypothetical protein n=1 Tax=Streptomyces sp. NPDC087440 TaxID=3365790 RepID=UPI00381EB940
MTDRSLTPGTLDILNADVRDHEYAIVQTRIERAPVHLRATQCTEPDGCTRPATLVTVAVAEVVDDGEGGIGFRLARDDADKVMAVSTCDDHRAQASHDLYGELTGRERADGIRAFDAPGQHMQWG